MTTIYGAALFCIILTTLNLISIAIVMVRTRRRPAPLSPPKRVSGVTVVRPVCGLDNFCEDTLQSSFSLDYPNYEVIFCVARPYDPVVPLVSSLIARHPQTPARFIIGDEKFSPNPKLNNCVRGWDAARHDWIILADANVLMPKDYIQRLLASWRPDTGLVCSMPLGSRPRNIWAEFECAFLNTYEARWQYCAEAMGMGFAQGKSMLLRRDIIEAGGGIRALASEIIEDAASTKLVREQGRSVHLVDSPFEQPLGARTAAEVLSRQLRWARTRRKTFPLAFAPEILAGVVFPLAAALYMAHSMNWSAAGVFLAVALAWYVPESLLAISNGWHFSWRMPFLFFLRDLLLPFIYIDAWFIDRFVWRGNEMSMREEASTAEGG